MSMFSHPAVGRLRLRVDERGRVVDEEGKVYSVRDAVRNIPWVKAVKYPPPHQYVVFERCHVTDWEVVNTAILQHPDSYLGWFRGYQKPNRYWDFEGHRYWRTSSYDHGTTTHMLNRGRFEDAEPPRRDGPAKSWDGPPWELEGTPWPEWYVRGRDGVHRYVASLDPYVGRKRRP
jgi:hypothetical protein